MPRALRMRRVLAAVVVLWLGGVASAWAEDRVALLMGNAAYHGAPLPNGLNDVEAMAAVLRDLGFKVRSKTNLTRKEMLTEMASFAAQVKTMSGGVALFYFSGHGIRYGERNYIVPIGAEWGQPDLVPEEAIAAERLVELMGRQRGVVKLVVLDACRNNPFVKGLGFKGAAEAGLGKSAELPPTGTLVAYAAAPNQLASAGREKGLSVYTEALVQALRQPNLPLMTALGQAAELVHQRTVDTPVQQDPWVEGPPPPIPVILNDRPDLDPKRKKAEELEARNQALEAELKALRARREEVQQVAVTPPPVVPVQPPVVTPVVGVYFPPGKVFKDCAKCPEMVVVPKDEFEMGSPDNEPQRDKGEGPQHRVTIGRDFAVGKVEVTFAEWDACVAGGGCNGYKPSDEGWGRGRHPVINVSWEDAQSYVAWLKQQTGQPYRLLTEAEWEYAARAGTTTPFSTGPTITPDQANFDGDYTYNGSAKGTDRQRTVDVGSFKPNAFGLYDMHGNVLEWVEDCLADSYAKAPRDGTAYTIKDCERRVLRGGSWGYGPGGLRSADRVSLSPGNRGYVIGFRLARTFF